MLTPIWPSRCATDCMRPGWSIAHVFSRNGSAGARCVAPASAGRSSACTWLPAAQRSRGRPGDGSIASVAAGDQHHHRELPAQVDHAAVLEVPAALGDVARDLVDETGAVVADGGEHGVVQGVHGADSSGIAGARQSSRAAGTSE